MTNEIKRVDATPLAKEWLRRLKSQHGPLLMHQSGGCCDGSSPMCYPRDEFKVGMSNIYLGDIEGTPVYIGEAQFEYWQHTRLLIDVVPGRGGGFSLESPEGIRFLTRSDVLNEEDMKALDKQGPPRRGPQ